MKSFLFAAALASAVPASADPLDQWAPYIARASARFGIPRQWIRRVIWVESNGRTMLDGRPIVSRAGAMGLMQLMPGTWLEMRSALGLGTNPFDPHDNITAGTAYLRSMYIRFGYPGLFAAYNAGPSRYAAYVSGASALPAETRAYLASIAPTSIHSSARTGPAPSRLFALGSPRDGEEAPPGRLLRPASGALFSRMSCFGSP